MNRFWGIHIEPKKMYSQSLEFPLRLQKAVLGADAKDPKQRTLLYVVVDKKRFLLGSLRLVSCESVDLSTAFAEGDSVSFFVTGSSVHLTGEYETDLMDFRDDYSESDEESDEEEAAKEQLEMFRKAGNGDFSSSGSESDDEESEDDEDEVLLADKIKQAKKKQKLSNAEPITPMNSKQKASKAPQAPKGTPARPEKKSQTQTPKTPKKQEPKTPKKQEPKTPKKQEPKTPKKQEQKTPKKQEPKTPSKQQKQAQQHPPTPKPKNKGGVIIKSEVQGSGPIATPGRQVRVKYTGRLQKNGRVFDSNSIAFKLGAGEVIRGWDLGVEGMKVGGKRQLIIPAKLGYGSRGAPPDIPGNSTLVFDVELKQVAGGNKKRKRKGHQGAP